MTINLHLPAKTELLSPTITVIGVGGAGGNAVNNMIASHLEGVNFVVANTDAQALDHSLTERTIQLGAGITKGLGAGANPDVGRAAAEEAGDEIAAYIEGSNMVFITAGMGGGTGTGAAPVVARIAKEMGVLTVAVVTKPFQFEGTKRMHQAEIGLKELQEYVDTLIVIPNQNLFRIATESTGLNDAFKMADEVLHSGVRGVTDLMVKPGLINLDFADIRTVMREMGKAMMGTGEATGARRAIEAAEAAISNPLLDDISLKGARALLINITGGNDMTLFEVDEAANRVREEVDSEANIIFGTAFSDSMEGKMRVSVVATGIDAQAYPTGQKFIPAAIIPEPKKPIAFAIPPKQELPKPIAARAQPMFEPLREPSAARPVIDQRANNGTRPEKQLEMPQYQPIEEAEPTSRVRVVNDADLAADYRATDHRTAQKEPVYVREPASAPLPEGLQERRANPAAISPRREQPRERDHYQDSARDEGLGKSIFQRVADVGRSLSSGTRHEAHGKMDAGDRVQVVQKPQAATEPTQTSQQKLPNEDQYLDIPAFLRRQAN